MSNSVSKEVMKQVLAGSPPCVMGTVKGTVKVPCRVNVSFTKDVSGSLKLLCGGKTIDVYINDYRMLFRFLKLKGEIREVVVSGPLSVKAFMDSGGKRAGCSTRVQAENVLVYLLGDNEVLKKVFFSINEHHVGQETCKYYLMRQAYQHFENSDKVITGKCAPDNLYEELTKLHKKLCFEYENGKEGSKEMCPNIERRAIEKTLEDYIVKSNKFTKDFIGASDKKQLELLDDEVDTEMDDMSLHNSHTG